MPYRVIATAAVIMVELRINTERAGERANVDTHGKRGLSYLKIGLRKLMRMLYFPKLLSIWILLSPLPLNKIQRAFRLPERGRRNRLPKTHMRVYDVYKIDDALYRGEEKEITHQPCIIHIKNVALL